MIPGGRPVAARYLAGHRDLDKLAFTGSTAVGKALRKQTAGTGVKLSLELGGKSPIVVFDSADLDSAVEGIVDGIWFNQGQVCCAGSRLLVQESVASTLVAKIKARMKRLRVGTSLDKCVDMGPMADPVQRARVAELVRRGVAEGATVYTAHPELCPDVLPLVQGEEEQQQGGEDGDDTDSADSAAAAADVSFEGSTAAAGRPFFPPTLVTDVGSASCLVQEEIFGPVLVVQTFRTAEEAVELANNTRYGLSAGVWTENVALALETALSIKAGVIWVNSHNLFDAAAGFGGYKESGFGREGGKEGLYAYTTPSWRRDLPHPSPPPGLLTDTTATAAWGTPEARLAVPSALSSNSSSAVPSSSSSSSSSVAAAAAPLGAGVVDRTPKMYIGGAQKRPDGNYTMAVLGGGGGADQPPVELGRVGDGNRKDVRDAVEAAHKAAAGWGRRAAHDRAQILYYVAENLNARREEFAGRLCSMDGGGRGPVAMSDALREVDASIERLFHYAAFADKYGGTVQETTLYGLTAAVNEPVGVVGITCPEHMPLLGFISLVAPAVVRGNTVVVAPSQGSPLAATDLYQVLDTSDLPGGVINIVTGQRDVIARTLAEHQDVDGVWYFGDLRQDPANPASPAGATPVGKDGDGKEGDDGRASSLWASEQSLEAVGSYHVEALAAGNMKRTFVGYGLPRDWLDAEQGAGPEFLREATEVKNVWVPMGDRI